MKVWGVNVETSIADVIGSPDKAPQSRTVSSQGRKGVYLQWHWLVYESKMFVYQLEQQ